MDKLMVFKPTASLLAKRLSIGAYL